MNPKAQIERPLPLRLLQLATVALAALTQACIVVPVDDGDAPDLDDELEQIEEIDEAEGSGGAASSTEPTGLALGVELVDLPMMGGDGGEAFADECPTGEVLVGLGGFLDERGWHGRMAAGCAPIELVEVEDGTFVVRVGEWTATPMHGGVGQQPWISECPDDEIMVGFAGRAGQLVDQVQVACAPFEVVESADGFALIPGEVHLLDPVGGSGGSAVELTLCEEGSVATVVDMRAGESIDALGVACRSLELRF